MEGVKLWSIFKMGSDPDFEKSVEKGNIIYVSNSRVIDFPSGRRAKPSRKFAF